MVERGGVTDHLSQLAIHKSTGLDELHRGMLRKLILSLSRVRRKQAGGKKGHDCCELAVVFS